MKVITYYELHGGVLIPVYKITYDNGIITNNTERKINEI